MAKIRDDFSTRTKNTLAKRVGYLCSNPNCQKLTVGPNKSPDESTIIGEAAHITAASPGGPRYDAALTGTERSQIENGIWLCCNCATLIDKDEETYKKEILNNWKNIAEKNATNSLIGEQKEPKTGIPIIEADLICEIIGRKNNGLSNNNPKELLEDQLVTIFRPNSIYHFKLNWAFKLKLYNNSTYPAINIQIESIGTVHFTSLAPLQKVNNLPPLNHIELVARYDLNFEGISRQADEILKHKIPEDFNNLILQIKYLDESRNQHISLVRFANSIIQTEHKFSKT